MPVAVAVGEEEAAEGVVGAAGGAAGGAAARRRRAGGGASLLRAVAAAGRPLSLLNLRLSLVDRDFTDQDYSLLVRLDELEAGACGRPRALGSGGGR